MSIAERNQFVVKLVAWTIIFKHLQVLIIVSLLYISCRLGHKQSDVLANLVLFKGLVRLGNRLLNFCSNPLFVPRILGGSSLVDHHDIGIWDFA